MKKILPVDIVAYEPFCGLFPVMTDPVYANAEHPENHFGQIYHPKAQIWGHRDLVRIVLLTSKRLYDAHGWTLIVKDCLRTTEAQALMIETPIVKANPHWIEEPRFLSGPGMGGHPRGMAVDLDAMDDKGKPVDFGTPFDHFSASSDKDHNPAHREYPKSSAAVMASREYLEKAMVQAAKEFGLPMLPLPQEWWDFRFPGTYSNEFAPLSDKDLEPYQRMCEEPEEIDLQPDAQILEDLRDLV